MPCLTAASASASIESAMNAGPHPQMVPAALSCAVSTVGTSPMRPKSSRTACYSASLSEWRRSQTMIPSPTETGVLGIVERWWVPGASSRS